MIGVRDNKVSSRIYHGEQAKRGQRKYQLFLVASMNTRPYTKEGGATVVNKNFALTAAQLVTIPDGNRFETMEHVILSGGSTSRTDPDTVRIGFDVINPRSSARSASTMPNTRLQPIGYIKVHEMFNGGVGDGYGNTNFTSH